ncbi:MAG: hypothetical protein OEY86_16510 [Nitrospira sp.]|nr:hypothetical protein [Nitrospira sp.]
MLDGVFMRAHRLKAVVVSVIASAIFTLGSAILFSTGAYFLPPGESDKVDNMPFREAWDYLLDRAEHMSGWDFFLQGWANPHYWINLLRDWAVNFVFAFVCCGALLLWMRTIRGSSNNAVD